LNEQKEVIHATDEQNNNEIDDKTLDPYSESTRNNIVPEQSDEKIDTINSKVWWTNFAIYGGILILCMFVIISILYTNRNQRNRKIKKEVLTKRKNGLEIESLDDE